MADENAVKVPELSKEDLLLGDEEEIRGKVAAVIDKRVSEAEKRLSEAGKLPQERQSAMDDAMKGFAVFQDSDEDIRDYAKSLLNKEVSKLADGAGADEIKALAEKVSKKMAKLMVAGSNPPPAESGIEGPVPTGNGSAAAAHTTDAPPKNIEEAEALADKIAAAFSSGKK